jgi:hypothetical protein
MRIWVLKFLGREILRTESHQEATVSDVVQAMLAHRLQRSRQEEEGQEEEGEEEEMIECQCCGEMFDPAEAEEQFEVDEKFEEIAGNNLNWGERMVWDARAPEDEEDI